MRIVRACFIAATLCLFAHAAAVRIATPFVGRWHWEGPETFAADYVGNDVVMQINSRDIIF